MIKIELLDSIKKEIEEHHWEFFEKTGLLELKNLLLTESDPLRLKFYNLLLDDVNKNKKLKDIILGNPLELQSIILEVDRFINSNFKDYDFEKWEQNLEKTKILLPKPSKFKLPTLLKHVKDIEISTGYIDELKIKYKKLGKINTLGEANRAAISIKKEFEKLNDQHNSNLTDYKSLKIKLFSNLDKIFDYDKFIRSNPIWDAYSLTKKINFNTCPYCNRQFINTYQDDSGKTRPTLDHFYNKDEYPYLAISLYNLIPSCYICNSSLKGTKNFHKKTHVHPYEDGFTNQAVFKTNIKPDIHGRYPIEFLLGLGGEEDFELKLNINPGSPMEEKITNSNNTFKIENLYQFHKDYVLELIKKTVFYNNSKITELANQEVYRGLFSSKEEIIQILIGNYVEEKNLGKRILSKLTKDIWDEFKLDEIWFKP